MVSQRHCERNPTQENVQEKTNDPGEGHRSPGIGDDLKVVRCKAGIVSVREIK